MTFICPTCGKKHDELPDIGSAAPYPWTDSLQSDPRSSLDSDLCVIEARDYFVRGVLEIPIRGAAVNFGWGVWVSQKRENFQRYVDNFDSDAIGPFFGWLSTEIDYFAESTLNQKAQAVYQGRGQRPRIVLMESEHPLYLQQRDGIALEEAWKIVHFYEDSSESPAKRG